MYGTVEGADGYHLARGASQWAGSEAEKAAALLRGSEWLDGVYRTRFIGAPVTFAQARGWPRVMAYDQMGAIIAGTPEQVEQAAYEAALREIVTPFSLTPDIAAGPGIKRLREKVDVLETETEYTGSGALIPRLTIVEHILAPLLRPASGYSGAVVRG